MTPVRLALFAALLAAFCAGALAGGLFGFIRWRRAPSAAFQQVEAIILSRARDLPTGGVVVFGDSIVEQQQIETICGAPALNAGISGARVRHFIPLVPTVVGLARPSKVVVALGTNDVLAPRPTPLRAFSRQVESVFDAAGARAIIVGISAPGDDRDAAVAEANGVLKAQARRRGGTFVEPVSTALTTDGVHLSPAGMRDWKRRVAAACD